MTRSSIAVVSILVVASCTRRETVEPDRPRTATSTSPTTSTSTSTPPATSTSTPRATPPATSTSTPTPPEPKVAAWTDPEVVAELAKSCKWEPPKAKSAMEEENPLTCEANSFDQSCVYDPCFHKNKADCRAQCLKTCSSCGPACATQCETCKKSCTDDTCRAECAKSCGACRQACVVAKDQCMTGTCTKVYETCSTEARARFKKSACSGACAKFQKCRNVCFDKSTNMDACLEVCKKSIAAACPGDLGAFCELYGADQP